MSWQSSQPSSSGGVNNGQPLPNQNQTAIPISSNAVSNQFHPINAINTMNRNGLQSHQHQQQQYQQQYQQQAQQQQNHQLMEVMAHIPPREFLRQQRNGVGYHDNHNQAVTTRSQNHWPTLNQHAMDMDPQNINNHRETFDADTIMQSVSLLRYSIHGTHQCIAQLRLRLDQQRRCNQRLRERQRILRSYPLLI